MPTTASFFLFCDAAAISQENKLIIHGVIENVNATQFPAVHPSMAAVFRIEGPDVVSGAELNLRLRNVMNEKDVIDSKFPLNLQVPNNIFQGVVNILATQFENSGLYKASLLLNGKEIATTKLTVAQIA